MTDEKLVRQFIECHDFGVFISDTADKDSGGHETDKYPTLDALVSI
jgi:hypothetical protein